MLATMMCASLSCTADAQSGTGLICDVTNPGTPANFSPTQAVTSGTITIPVVFRNIYTPNGAGYQTEQRVKAQIDTLNAAFQRVATRAAAAGNPGLTIEFRLAALIRSMETSDPDGFQRCAQFSQVDPTRVLNICTEYNSNTAGSAGTLGVVVASNTALPGMVSGGGVNQEGGIITHEVGHYLNLIHTFGPLASNVPSGTASVVCPTQGQNSVTCVSDGDQICDTPPTLGNQSTAVIPPGVNTCPDILGPGGSDLPDDIENFMDYSLDPTWNNFSVDQLLWMRRTLQTAPAIANGNGRTIQIPQTFLVRPNDQVAFYDADFLFAAGARLDVQGTFDTFGATLTESSAGQGWGGVRYMANSAGTITGGEILNVKTYGGAAVSITSASPTLRNVVIKDSPCCGTGGVYVTGSLSNPTIQGATIRNMSGTGVTLNSYAHGRLIRNTIQNNGGDGVLSGYGTAPFLSPDAPNSELVGNTILFNAGNGVYASGSPTYVTYGWYYYGGSGYAHADGYNEIRGNSLAGNRVTLGGAIAAGGTSANRRNGFYDNIGNEAEAIGSGSRAYVSCDYWGPNSAPPFQTVATSGGTVTLFSYLTQNPRANPFEACQDIDVASSEFGKQGETPGGGAASARDGNDLGLVLEEAAGLAMSRPSEAFELLQRVVAEGDDALASAALAETGRIASGDEALPEARAFLAEQATSDDENRRMAAMRALVGVRHDAGDADGALAAARMLAEAPEPDDAAFGALASVYLFSEAGRDADAMDALASLEQLMPESREAALARRSLGLPMEDGRETESGQTAAKADGESEGTTELLAVRPNPTGGAAIVPFRLAEAARVQVTVYDVLGRSVAVLVDGAFEAGEHATTLDASRLAPGVYVVRFDVRGGTGEVFRQTRRVTVAR